MAVTESQLNIVLQEAFTCYLTFLYDTRKLQESPSSRAGRGAETPTDITTRQYFHIRINTTELCLQYLGDISKNLRKLVDDSLEPRKYQSATRKPESSIFDRFRARRREEPVIERVTAVSVRPAGFSSANLPRSLDESMAGRTHQRSSHSQSERPPSIRPSARSSSRAPKGSSARQSSTAAPTSKPLGPYPPPPSSTAGTVTPSPFISLYPFARRRYSNTPSTSHQSTYGDASNPGPRIARPPYQKDRRSAEDERYARRVQIEEKRKKDELERSLAGARRLAAEWEREEKTRLEAQEKYARNLQKEEKRRQERAERDREAARKAQKGQEQWAHAPKALETEATRTEDRRRRETQERAKSKHREQDSRSKVESHRVDRTHLVAEAKRREAQQVAESALRRQKENVKRKVVQRKVECVSCMEAGDSKDMVLLSCKHSYCGDCVKRAFKAAFKSRSPFKCCRKNVEPATNPSFTAYLSAAFIQKYTLLLLELSTPNPRYCSSPTCSLFLPLSTIHGSIGTCSCNTRTCILCTKPEHRGVCKEDKDGKRLEEMGKQNGWRMCSSCNAMVERTEGCLHITCRCGAEWCYACGRDWKVCGSACGRSVGRGPWLEDEPPGLGSGFIAAVGMAAVAAMVGMAGYQASAIHHEEERESRGNGGLALVPLIASAVLMALFHD